MLIDFSKVNLDERPVLLLCNADGTPIQYLGYAFNIEPELHYNETSSLSFDYPATADGTDVPNYDSLVGMREVLWQNVGYFILTNPEEKNDGLKRIKACTAYSAEYEFTYKSITLEEGTYDFYDPVDDINTVVGRIMELMPSWSIGSVDSALVGKYRTFDTVNDNVYNFIKSTVQDTYQCIFDFDTLNRKVHIRSANSSIETKPVYLSMKNLAKEIKIEEQTEDIFTCLDVNGADGVDIRSVNPLGTNKIYDLSYFMTDDNVGAELARKYAEWASAYEAARLPYFNTTVEMVLEQARLETEKAKLTTLNGERSTLEEQLSVFVEASAQGVDGVQSNITDIKTQITAKDAEISSQKSLLEDIQDKIDVFYETLKRINGEVSFSSFFTSDELQVLDKYIKEDSIQDSNFVVSEVTSYIASDRNEDVTSGSFSINDSKVMVVSSSSGKDIYSVTGGTIQMVVNGKTLSASIVRGAIERQSSDGAFVLTAYLNRGTFVGSDASSSSFPSGCVSMTGSCGSITHDCVRDSGTGAWSDGTSVSSSSIYGHWYLTENATEYQKRAVEWDLFEYGKEQLQSVSWPAFTFSVDSCNFLVPEEFISFRNQLALGKKIYIDVNGKTLEPILIGCSFSFEDLASLTLEFGDKYNCRDARFDLTDLLDQSISSGKSVDFNKYNYNAFVDSGASNSVLDFMNAALDASKNAVISGANQAIVFDQTGLRLRKADGNGGFLPEQIWAINNNIAFTDDNWNTAKMAIGKFVDANLGSCWGIVAPNIIGTLLAGNNLVIESAKKSGANSVFRVDANGAQLHNASFDLIKGNGQITLYPETGFVGGTSTSSAPMFTFDANGDISGVRTKSGSSLSSVTSISKTDLPNANFWIDMNGNAYFKGKVYATDGEFSGTIHATDGDFKGTIKAATLEGTLIGSNGGEIKGVSLGIGGSNYDNFVVDSSGNVTMKGSINLANGTITWGSNLPDSGISEDEAIALIDEYGYTPPRYIKSTYISNAVIKSPIIKGNNMEVYGAYKVVRGSGSTMGYMGAAYGQDAYGNTTSGVAIASGYTTGSIADSEGDGDTTITYASDGNYVIATSGGCRMQASKNSIVVTPDGAYLKFITPSGNTQYQIGVSANGCQYYDGSSWKSIGSGGGTVTAKWG